MPLALTCADYARIMPLAVGAVPAEFELILGRRGAWPARAEMLRRATGDDTVAGGEASMGIHRSLGSCCNWGSFAGWSKSRGVCMVMKRLRRAVPREASFFDRPGTEQRETRRAGRR